MRLFVCTLLLVLTQNTYAQQWGYATLIASSNSTSISLIDTNNAVIKAWTGLSGSTGYACYLTEGGNLWRTVKATGASFNGGGICGRIQKIAYNGTLLFDYQINTAEMITHHDICPLPNGNVMVIIYQKKTAAQVQAAGGTANAARWTEIIYELEPTGLNTANIVWEWHLWDHLVQNADPNKANYQSSIVNNPQLLHINYQNTMADWVHMNGIDYNPELDQIVVSSHFLNEMWVIDHSTTTAEAASHAGGNGGKGGDFLYRWGNPAAYGASGTAVFNVMHDAHWIPAGYPNAGYLAGFNNKGVSNNASAVDLFNPPLSGYNYTITPGQAYEPATYATRHAVAGYSSNMGNSQQLPNGNMLICVATQAKVYEITPNNTQIWSYIGNGAIPQSSRYTRCFVESPQVTVLTPSPSVCSGGATSLDITPAASGPNTFTYNWAPATGLSGTTVQDPTVSGISSPTTYTVTITTPGGCTATGSVLVGLLPTPNANAGSDVSINLGQSTTLIAAGDGTFLWSNGATTASTEVSPNGSTTYTVTVTNPGGCTATDEVTVTIGGIPLMVAITGQTSICQDQSASLSANITGGSGSVNIEWSSIPEGFVSNLANIIVTPLQTTQYQVVVSDGISTMTATSTVIVYPTPNASAGADVNIASGATTTLTATGGATYLWSTGATTASILASPTQSTTYTVTVTNTEGCTAEDAVIVTVLAMPLGVTITSGDLELCNGEFTQLFATATGGLGNYTFTWGSNPSGFESTLPDPFVNPSENTTYTVLVSDGVATTTISIAVVVLPLPPQPSITVDGFTLTSSASVGNQWFLYGAPITDANGQQHLVTLTGAYQVQTVDANGCFSPLSNPVELTVSGSYDLDKVLAWDLVPNPAHSIVHLVGDLGHMPFRIMLYHATGALVLDVENIRSLDVSRLPTGAYWAHLQTERGSAVRKIIVRR